MRILHGIACCLLFVSAPAFANHIGIYVDPAPTRCILEVPPQFVPTTIYVVALPTGSTPAAAFMLQGGLPAGWISLGSGPIGGICDFSCDPFQNPVGWTRTCAPGAFPLWTLSFMATNTSTGGGCNHLTVINAIIDDCAFSENSATGGSFSFVTGLNQCAECTVAVEPSTWGSVKALYR